MTSQEKDLVETEDSTDSSSQLLPSCSKDQTLAADCKVSSGSVVTDSFGQNITAWSNVSGSTAVTGSLPTGYYTNKTVTFSDNQLIGANIVAGVQIFGVTGTAAGLDPACVTNGLQSSNCTAASGSYWTSAAGANVTGAAGSLSATISAGYYSGAQSCTMSDANLTAANIKSGTTVFGTAGSLTPAYAACTDDALNASQCSTTAGRYVYANSYGGRNTNCAIGLNSQACWTNATNYYVYDGFYPRFFSQAPRNNNTTQLYQYAETTTYAGASLPAGYRDIPLAAKDDDGLSGVNVTLVDRSSWADVECGTSQATIALRIANCAANPTIGSNATWDGTTKGNSGQGIWKLVIRKNYGAGINKEVWQDTQTGLLWSSLIDNNFDGTAEQLNWCKGTGSNYSTTITNLKENDSICKSAFYQNTATAPISACFESLTAGDVFDSTYNGDPGKGGLGIGSTPAVRWRLPTLNDYMQAEVNGLRLVLNDFTGNEWTATVSSANASNAWFVTTSSLFVKGTAARGFNGYIRCVGR